MRWIFMLAAIFMTAIPAHGQAGTYDSVYTRLNHERDCRVVSSGAGGATDLLCPGVGDYTYLLRSTDGRESVTYGYASRPGMATFGRFNYANGTVEWRVKKADPRRPLAAIQRWFLADLNGKWATQILVVSKVGQPRDQKACVIGYVDARDGAPANVRARVLADKAANFRCGTDRPSVERGIADLVPPA